MQDFTIHNSQILTPNKCFIQSLEIVKLIKKEEI